MYEIEKDPGQKRTKDGHVEYCIKWKGYALSEATNMGAEMERLMQDGLPKTDQGVSTRNGYASSSKRKEERTAAAGPETDARQTEAERGTTERQLVQQDHPTGAEQVGKQKKKKEKTDPMLAKDAQQCCMKDDLLYRLWKGRHPTHQRHCW